MRVEGARARLEALERAAAEFEGVGRVRAQLERGAVAGAFLRAAPADYYSWALEQRACVCLRPPGAAWAP